MKAIYAGSFDPFTNGHEYILEEASKIFDEVHLLIAINPMKKRRSDTLKMKEAIEKIASRFGNVKVVSYSGLIADYAKQYSIEYYVRGVRNTTDFNYEEIIAKENYALNKSLKTIYIRSKDEFISSSFIWELIQVGKDYSKFVPKEIVDVLG